MIETDKKYVCRFRPGNRVVISDGFFADCQEVFDYRLSDHDRGQALLELLQDQKIRL